MNAELAFKSQNDCKKNECNESKKKTTRHIQVENNGQITTYEKEVSPNDLNDAVAKTIIYYYKLLTKKPNEK